MDNLDNNSLLKSPLNIGAEDVGSMHEATGMVAHVRNLIVQGVKVGGPIFVFSHL